MEPLRTGLSPVIGERPRVLLLGSFPSQRSLETGHYYANPRNQFWALVGAVFGIPVDTAYDERLAALVDRGVTLWDVIARCRRTGSLDSRIERKSLVVNDFERLLTEHPSIERVYLNGATAFDLFARHVATPLPQVRLPSSSPAATMPFRDKLAAWVAIT